MEQHGYFCLESIVVGTVVCVFYKLIYQLTQLRYLTKKKAGLQNPAFLLVLMVILELTTGVYTPGYPMTSHDKELFDYLFSLNKKDLVETLSTPFIIYDKGKNEMYLTYNVRVRCYSNGTPYMIYISYETPSTVVSFSLGIYTHDHY